MSTKSNTNTAEDVRRVFIVEDHPVVRSGLRLLFEDEPDLMVSGEAPSVPEAMTLIEEDPPHVVLVDLVLKESDGLELVARLRDRTPPLPCLVISALDENTQAQKALRAGAKGYIMKGEDVSELLLAVRRVLSGEVYLSQRMTREVLDRIATGESETSLLDSLSPREREVFDLIGEGLRTAEVAEKLTLSPKTVLVHQDKIKKKLRLRDSFELHHVAFSVHRDGKLGSGQ